MRFKANFCKWKEVHVKPLHFPLVNWLTVHSYTVCQIVRTLHCTSRNRWAFLLWQLVCQWLPHHRCVVFYASWHQGARHRGALTSPVSYGRRHFRACQCFWLVHGMAEYAAFLALMSTMQLRWDKECLASLHPLPSTTIHSYTHAVASHVAR